MNSLEAGQKVGKYKLSRRLDAGGMGDVWLAHDGIMGRDVALKFLSPRIAAEPGMVDMLRRECLQAREIRHSGAVHVYDFDIQEGRPFLCMEYIEGHSLRDHLKGCPDFRLPWRQALQLGRKVAETLMAMHKVNIIHRDIKPANILLRGGNIEDPVLIDFGIAGQGTRTVSEVNRVSGGTLGYMSPLQLADGPPCPADDMYSLGAVLFEMLAGRKVFSGTPAEVRAMTMSGAAPSLAKLLQGQPVPASLCSLVDRLLAKYAQARGGHIRQIIQQMRDIETSSPLAGDSSASKLKPGSEPDSMNMSDKTMVMPTPVRPLPADFPPPPPPAPPGPRMPAVEPFAADDEIKAAVPGTDGTVGAFPAPAAQPAPGGKRTLLLMAGIFAAAFAGTLGVLLLKSDDPGTGNTGDAAATTAQAPAAPTNTPAVAVIGAPMTNSVPAAAAGDPGAAFAAARGAYAGARETYVKIEEAYRNGRVLADAESTAAQAEALAAAGKWDEAGVKMRAARDALTDAHAVALAEKEKIERIAAEKGVAEESRKACLQARAEAEARKAGRHAAALYQKAAGLQAAAEKQTEDAGYAEAARGFAAATGQFRDAVAAVDALAREASGRMDGHLEACATAEAGKALDVLKDVTPDDARISRWQARLDQNALVANHLRAGDAHREKDSWPMALTEYSQACDLDPDHLRARALRQQYNLQALDWMERRIHQAHDAKDWAACRDMCAGYLKSRPEHPAIRAIAAEAESHWAAERIQAVLKEAATKEDAGDWRGALASYREAERLAPSHPDVVRGVSRSQSALEKAAKAGVLRGRLETLMGQGNISAAEVVAGELEALGADPRDRVLVESVRRAHALSKMPVEVRIHAPAGGEMNIVGVTNGYAPAAPMNVKLVPGDYRWTIRIPNRAGREGWFSVRPGMIGQVIELN